MAFSVGDLDLRRLPNVCFPENPTVWFVVPCHILLALKSKSHLELGLDDFNVQNTPPRMLSLVGTNKRPLVHDIRLSHVATISQQS
jgi:hypothetical protein